MTDLPTHSFPDPSGDEPHAEAESQSGPSPAQDPVQDTQGALMPEPQLDRVEERVLACLVEKAITTPDYYPLTLNSLTAACRQKSNRNPVVDIDEQTVESALERLQAMGLTRVVTGADQRVAKYRQVFGEGYGLQPPEVAVLCELMLRGPQTLGELRGRASRMHPFEDIGQVEQTIQHLVARSDSLVIQLERQPGRKESRFAHRLAGEPAAPMVAATPTATATASSAAAPRVVPAVEQVERLEKLETRVEEQQTHIEDLQKQLESFRQQFE